MSDLNLRSMLKAGVHFGHQTRYWSPSMSPYIFGERNKIHIINLEKTLPMMKEAMNFIATTVAQGGNLLIVGTKRQAGRYVREHAKRAGCSYVDYRWLGGMLTNYKTVKNSISKLKELERRIESGETNLLTKKEALTIERERTKLDRTLSGIKDMRGLPDAIFVIDVEAEYIAVNEANKLGIPVIAVVDTNCNVKGIDYIIPGNDDSSRAIDLYLSQVADTVLEAKSRVKTVVAPVGDDEYVELDDEGNVVSAAEAESAPAAKEEATEEVAKEKADATEKDKAEAKTTKKKAAKKKATKKKVVKKKAASSAADSEKSASEKSE